MLARMPRLPLLLPAHWINGFTVALGVAVVNALIAAAAGAPAAHLAMAGAVCASLADTPNTVRRNGTRVLGAALLAALAALVVALLKPWPAALTLGIAGTTFAAMMILAWGVRAGPMSFAAVLSLVFAMAVPSSGGSIVAIVLWPAVGALGFAVWSVLSTALLQPVYRRLALAGALQALARLLRSRAALLETGAHQAGSEGRLRTWIGDEAVLAERLQGARDLLFDAPARARAEIAILLHAIELRDALLASRLDLELLADDEAGRWVRDRIAVGLRQVAVALDRADEALRGLAPADASGLELRESLQGGPVAPDDARARLLPVFSTRLQRLADEVTHIHALLRGATEPLPLTGEELRLFVAPEGWPLAALRAQLTTQSPVLRHSVRAALALGCAFALGHLLPWASHPHWLVLSVAVVLRGNLEQTLARRNARVAGTMIGCLAVLALSRAPALQAAAFLVAVGVAHGFVNVRYLVTAIAATVMALMQAHLVDPAGGFAIAERLADTLIGAALAWAFSYVLPSWERRSLPRAVVRSLAALRRYAHEALQHGAPAASVAQRLSRLQAYDALGALAAALQRSAPEPRSVRLPLHELAELLDHAHRLMAHLSVVRMMLVRRASTLQGEATALALQGADLALQASLAWPAKAPLQAPASVGVDSLPDEPPAQQALPWLQRRLQVTQHDAYQVGRAARELLKRVS
jgi:uncharacterized membrane protein YccC